MGKHLAVLFIFSFMSHAVLAQAGTELMIKGYGKDIHLDHKVAPKEGIFAIGRHYNVHPKAIAAYNKLDMARGLVVGQLIHIPLTDTNFSQKNTAGTPIYYTVGQKESLQKVSNVNNKVPLESLREWNKLANDNIAAGKKLIVGFLITNAPTSSSPAPPQDKKQVTGVTTDKQDVKTREDEKTVAIADTKKQEPVHIDTPKEEAPKPVLSKKTEATLAAHTQGYFKSSFDEQVKANPVSRTETVTAGVFKMVSGGQEAKYYMLMDEVPSGTIVRIINPDNNKAIYAKVLGEMSGIRQNQGLNIRISNTAASTLGITDTEKFIVKINY